MSSEQIPWWELPGAAGENRTEEQYRANIVALKQPNPKLNKIAREALQEAVMIDALREAERFMAYFAGETGGSFVGPGTPKSCLEQIREALAVSNGCTRR